MYRYRIASYVGTTQSDYTSVISVLSPLVLTPANLSATTTPTSIQLNWSDNSVIEDGFKIERDDGTGFVEIADLGTNFTSYTDESIEYDILYTYRVASYVGTTQSDYTSVVTVLSPLVLTPANLSATTTPTSIQLNWSDNSIIEDGFKIERDDGTGFVEIADLGTNFTSYTDESLEYNILYTYRIAAYEGVTQSEYTSLVSVNSPLILTPSNLASNVAGTQVELSWIDNSSIEDGFKIFRNNGSGYIEIADLGSDTTEYTDYGLNYGVTYAYQVLAYVGTDESEYTNEVSVTVGIFSTQWETITAATYTIGEPGSTSEHVVGVDYEIMRYEVTNAQYASFLEAALIAGEITVTSGDGFYMGGNLLYNLAMNTAKIAYDGSSIIVSEGFEFYPVTEVTWYGADEYASYYGWSLPSEQEWEIAARGDSETDYPWGNGDPNCDLANYFGCNDGLIEVGQTSGVSPFGVYDMVGNAWEWTSSFYDGANDTYVFRGGSWSEYTDNLKVWFRTEGLPTSNYGTIGFRCIR